MLAELEIKRVVREEFLPFALPSIGEEEIAEVVDTLRSGWITTGPKVKAFEEQFAHYVSATHALAVNSCTAALHTALTALGIGLGDEVIVPTFTFCATANVVVHLGAHPVLVDIGSDFQILPEAIEAAITEKTRAIMPVHYAGQACDLDAIYEIAARYDLAVIEDAAHAVGTTYGGHKIGGDELQARFPHLRRATAFSFYANKNMTTGEGGMLTTADAELAQKMRTLTLHGMSKDAWKRYMNAGSWYYEVVAAGYKNNMTDIAAALGIHQLRRLESFIQARQRIARMYDEAFADLPSVLTPLAHADRNHVYHLYALRLCLEELTIDRAEFIEKLKAQGIGSSVHFIPIHLHPFYQSEFGYTRGDLPHAEAAYESVVSLPLYPLMSRSDALDVIEAVTQLISTHRR
ncbi:MAG: DegT/DnrJ/EryC1/StrS aminotransferase family protein [Pyrinomonadaceae bacterium]